MAGSVVPAVIGEPADAGYVHEILGLVTVHVHPVPLAAVGVNCEGNESVTVTGWVSDDGLEPGTWAVNFTLAAVPDPTTAPLEAPFTVLVIASVGAAWRFAATRLLNW
jgi:hypothetical protein